MKTLPQITKALILSFIALAITELGADQRASFPVLIFIEKGKDGFEFNVSGRNLQNIEEAVDAVTTLDLNREEGV